MASGTQPICSGLWRGLQGAGLERFEGLVLDYERFWQRVEAGN